jgi:hypothetical protein
VLLLGCPKFDDAQGAIQKLAALLREAAPASVTVLKMEVPCCAGLAQIAARAAGLAGRSDLPLNAVTLSTRGQILSQEVLSASPAPGLEMTS